MSKPMFIFFFVLLSGMISFGSVRKHILLSLLSLEYMSLGLYFYFFDVLGTTSLFFSLIFISFTACEAALGLSLIVRMSRCHGSDYFSVFSL